MKKEQSNNRINFTKNNLESLSKPENGYKLYFDTKIPGLCIRVRSTGLITFFLCRRIGSQVEYVTIGRYPAVFPEEARQRAKELNAKIVMGKNPAEEKRNIKAEMTLKDLFDKFLKEHAKKYKRTWHYDELMFDKYFSQWSTKRISSISRRDVQSLHGSLGTDHKAQANRAIALLSAMYEKAKEWGYAGENPCFKLKKFHEESRDRYLKEKELPKFFKAVLAEPSQDIRDFFQMLIFTGARRSNVQSMAWKDINLDLKVWTIPSEKSKNAEAYTVPLVSSALEILKRRDKVKGESEWVFPSESKTGHLVEPKRAWERLKKTSKITDIRIHDLRRTLGTWMAITGSSMLTISHALGHKLTSLSITAVYARASVEPIRIAMENAVQAMLRQKEKKEENIVEFKSAI